MLAWAYIVHEAWMKVALIGRFFLLVQFHFHLAPKLLTMVIVECIFKMEDIKASSRSRISINNILLQQFIYVFIFIRFNKAYAENVSLMKMSLSISYS